ncbi:MAG: hypothetical protein GXP31_00895 [Kiritimatiellaeota bacterium]|nr:hypothetical protein [Kiritimatiellota bacterium]
MLAWTIREAGDVVSIQAGRKAVTDAAATDWVFGACVGKNGNALHPLGVPPACRAVALAKAGTASGFMAASWRSPPEADHSVPVGGRLGYASAGVGMVTTPASCREIICGTGDA